MSTEEEIRSAAVGELKPLTGPIVLAGYDPGWPQLFEREAERIRAALRERAIRVEHAGSTSVPGLAAKPVIDVVLVVTDSADEEAYVPPLEQAGYVLSIREPDWYEHRVFKGPDTNVNLHVFSQGCPEIQRMVLFRDWLRRNESDRRLYERTKRELAEKEWKYTRTTPTPRARWSRRSSLAPSCRAEASTTRARRCFASLTWQISATRKMGPEPFIQTVSGRRINPFAPEQAAIDIGDVAHALANQCRFGGHCRRFYSVAQHSCLVADVTAGRRADRETTLWALLHDAAEAYLGDVPHPVKHNSELGRLYRDAEHGIHGAILKRFGLPLTPPPVVAEVDRAVLAAERQALMVASWDWPELEGIEAVEVAIDPWQPEQAAREFLERYGRLSGAPESRAT